MNIYRIKRVESELIKIFNNTLLFKINDPRLKIITITDIKISKDFSYANIYFTYYDKKLELQKIHSLLFKASGVFKNEIAKLKILRKIPQLTFKKDAIALEAEKIDKVLKNLN